MTATYQQASSAAVERANEARIAEAEAERLRKLLDTGLKQRDLFQKGESKRLNEEIGRLGLENWILKEERRRTQEADIRKKASLWDSHLADLATRREAALARVVDGEGSEATSEDSDFSDSMLKISHVEGSGGTEDQADPMVYPCEWRYSSWQTCTALALSREVSRAPPPFPAGTDLFVTPRLSRTMSLALTSPSTSFPTLSRLPRRRLNSFSSHSPPLSLLFSLV